MPRSEKGIVLLLVLSLIMIGAVLAGVIMNITLSHFELTRHKVQRIRAYYAALAGMNLAFEQLRVGNSSWTAGGNHTLCESGCDVNDADIPYRVDINITPTGGSNYTLNISANYTSTLPPFRGRN